jgi:hypothetical protein
LIDFSVLPLLESMKKSPLLVLAGAVIALLSSCTTSSLYVVNDRGEPLDGVILEPVALQYGCHDKDYTGPCGQAAIYSPQRVNLRRVDYNSVLEVDLDPTHSTYVRMTATGLGGRDRPTYWTGYSSK